MSHYTYLYSTVSTLSTLFFDFAENSRDEGLRIDLFRANSGTSWEVNGLEVNPGFNISTIDDSSFDPNTIWERYRPTSPQVFTRGVSYSGLNWPEMDGVVYRGVVGPGSVVPTLVPTPTPSPVPGLLSGDLDADGDVDIFDLVIVGSNFGDSSQLGLALD